MPKKSRNYGVQRHHSPLGRITYHYKNGSRSSVLSTPIVPYADRRIGEQSVIIDQTGQDRRFRPCSHNKVKYDAKPLGSMQTTQYADIPYVPSDPPTKLILYEVENMAAGVHPRHYSKFLDAVGQSAVSVQGIPWATLASTAVQKTFPSFHSENNLVNFVLELKDFKHVVKMISGRFSSKLTLLQQAAAFVKKGKRALDFDFSKSLKWLSKRHLEYNFGWRPLYNDVNALLKAISGFDAAYKKIVIDGNKPVTKHWSTIVNGTSRNEVIYHVDNVGLPNNNSWYGDFRYGVCTKVTRHKSDGVKYNASVRMRYSVPPELLTAGGQAKAWLDYLGVSQNPATVWNAIPFTFLIDWVINIGKYLDRLRTDNISFQTEIVDFCHSAKLTQQVTYAIALRNFTGGSYGTGPWTVTDAADVSTYERRVGLPDLTLAIQTSGLNGRELSLAGALVAVRR